jgi:hypothetical protein
VIATTVKIGYGSHMGTNLRAALLTAILVLPILAVGIVFGF